MRPSSIARRYAEAAFEVARSSDDVSAWLRELQVVEETFSDVSLLRYFRDPNVGREEKLNALEKLFPHLRPEILNLLRILAIRGRLGILSSIRYDIERLDRDARGVAEVSVTTARPVDDAERQAIAQRLGAATGKTVEVHTNVDPSIIGGIVVRVGDRLVDASIAGRLQRLRQDLAT
jgi:F-type H+-transporting ATPase subunit delta